MVTIIGLCGSLRNGSFNRMLLHTAAELSPPGMTIEPESIGEIPLYDTDVEEQGMPLVVQRLKDRIAHADVASPSGRAEAVAHAGSSFGVSGSSLSMR